jgi:hypothetical protein
MQASNLEPEVRVHDFSDLVNNLTMSQMVVGQLVVVHPAAEVAAGVAAGVVGGLRVLPPCIFDT